VIQRGSGKDDGPTPPPPPRGVRAAGVGGGEALHINIGSVAQRATTSFDILCKQSFNWLWADKIVSI
jgi:hypothetical protein